MQLTRSEIKIKSDKDTLKSFLGYLNLILHPDEDYLKGLNVDKLYIGIVKHNLQVIAEKCINLLYKNNFINKNYTLKLTHGERLTLFIITFYYPLPTHLIEIEYILNDKLIKDEY